MADKKKSIILFNLIKSMTQSEKRYFKMFVSVFERKDKTYVKLYTAIEKQNAYNEKALKEKFASEKFVKHFAVVKNGLYNMILKSLRFYHHNEDIQEKVAQYKSNFKILLRKGFFIEAKAQLEKAIKIADEAELIEAQIDLAELRISTFTQFDYNNHKREILEQKLELPFIYLERLKDYLHYKNFTIKLDFALLRNQIRSEEAQNSIDSILGDLLLEDNKEPLTDRAKSLKYHAKLACFVSMKDYKNAFKESKNIYDLASKEKSFLKLLPINVVGIYNNYLFTAIKAKPLKECKDIAQKYNDLLIETKSRNNDIPDYEGRLFESSHHFILEYHLFKSEFQKIKAILPSIEAEFSKIETKTSPFLYIFYNYNIAYAHFGIGNFEATQDYLIKLINFAELKSRKDYFTAVHLLNIFNHYELENYEHLISQIKNTKQLIKRQEYLFPFEKTAIDLLSKLSKDINKSKKSIVLNKHSTIFKELFTKNCEKDAFEKLDMNWWIDKQLNNIS